MLEGRLGSMKLGDFFLELGAMSTVFDEETLVLLVRIFHLLGHGTIFGFQRADLIHKKVVCRCGVRECFRMLGVLNGHCCELCFRHLVLLGDAHVLYRELGVSLLHLFLFMLSCRMCLVLLQSFARVCYLGGTTGVSD